MLKLRTVWSRWWSLATPLATASLVAVAALLPMAGARAQDGGTLRLIVPYPAGGGSDRAARLVAEALQPRLNQTVIVENVVGVGGRPAMREKFKAMSVVPVSMDRRQSIAMIEGFKKSWWPAIDKAGLKFD